MDWYKNAQKQNIYEELGDLGIAVRDDGAIDIYPMNNGMAAYNATPDHLSNVNSAISQQYIIKRALEDDCNKLLAFVDDLLLLVEKINDFPVIDVPTATENIPIVEDEEELEIEEELEAPEQEDFIPEESNEIEQIDESEFNQPYPFIPNDPNAYHPQYGYWYHPFDVNQYEEKAPEDIAGDLEQREILQMPPFMEQEEIIAPQDIPDNKDIVQEVEEDVVGAEKTISAEEAQNVANMIRQKYVYPMSSAEDDLKVEVRDRFNELATIYESGNVGSSINVVNMATRLRLEDDIRDKYQMLLDVVDARIVVLEQFLDMVSSGHVDYIGDVDDTAEEMQGYIIQPHSHSIFRVIKPGGAKVYYTDMANRTCTCPWGIKTSPYRYDPSACKHFKWINELYSR